MDIKTKQFRIAHGEQVDLGARPTRVAPPYRSPRHYREHLENNVAQLAEQQAMLYANGTHSLLVVFQAMDSAGKDSAIKHVMSGINPQGCDVSSFKSPSATELAHDFLWRSVTRLPTKGKIGIFNRSYYEDVLIARVQPGLLRASGIDPGAADGSDLWQSRFESINAMERHLHRNGTLILKFFLHLSKDEQRTRLLRRIDEPDKHWKFSAADLVQRKSWDAYQRAYEACLGATSSDYAPWYAVPADDKPTTHLIVSQILLDALRDMGMTYPALAAEQQAQLVAIRKELTR